MRLTNNELNDIESRADDIEGNFCMRCGLSRNGIKSLLAEIRALRKVPEEKHDCWEWWLNLNASCQNNRCVYVPDLSCAKTHGCIKVREVK